jgi:hypothetical protein
VNRIQHHPPQVTFTYTSKFLHSLLLVSGFQTEPVSSYVRNRCLILQTHPRAEADRQRARMRYSTVRPHPHYLYPSSAYSFPRPKHVRIGSGSLKTGAYIVCGILRTFSVAFSSDSAGLYCCRERELEQKSGTRKTTLNRISAFPRIRNVIFFRDATLFLHWKTSYWSPSVCSRTHRAMWTDRRFGESRGSRSTRSAERGDG